MPNWIKITLLIIAALTLGWLGGRYSSPSPSIEEEIEIIESPSQPIIDSSFEKLKILQEKLLAIEKIDLVEYRDLQDKREQYLKANEILGKVMLILLADLGLHLKSKDWQKLTAAEEPQEFPKPPQERMRESAPQKSRPNEGRYGYDFPDPNKEAQKEKKEDKPTQIMTKKGKLTNPTSFYRKSRPFQKTNPLFQKLQGSYWGDMIHLKEDIIEVVEFKVSYDYNGKEYEGNSTIIVYDSNGNQRGRSRSNGKNNNFQSNPADPEGIVIETSPTGFIHLRYNKRKNRFKGFYYSRPRGEKDYKIVAKIPVLKRR